MSNTDGEDTQRKLSDEAKERFKTQYAALLVKEELASLRKQLKQQEEVIRELTSSLVYIVKTLGALTLPQDEPEALAYYEALRAIEKAKSLTTKDK